MNVTESFNFRHLLLVTAGGFTMSSPSVLAHRAASRMAADNRPQRPRKSLQRAEKFPKKFRKRFMTTEPAGHFYEFGPFRLDPVERLLLRQDTPVMLTPKVFDILLLLVRNGGRALEKEDFMREIWPDSFVEEGNLNRNISTLRKALGDAQGYRVGRLCGRSSCFAGAGEDVL
jgi:DNA-binding response OmpR family regulator